MMELIEQYVGPDVAEGMEEAIVTVLSTIEEIIDGEIDTHELLSDTELGKRVRAAMQPLRLEMEALTFCDAQGPTVDY